MEGQKLPDWSVQPGHHGPQMGSELTGGVKGAGWRVEGGEWRGRRKEKWEKA